VDTEEETMSITIREITVHDTEAGMIDGIIGVGQ
jgi:hypothetical protein